MATRSQFLRKLWTDVIDAPMRPDALENIIANGERERELPWRPFPEIAPLLQRLLAAGATHRELASLMRYASYTACFRVLYMLDDPGVDDDDNKMMHEELLGADPSGRHGRPGPESSSLT